MKKAGPMSAEGLRILRDEGQVRLGEWATMETGGGKVADPARRDRLHEAVREASDRLAEAQQREA